ncbi:pyruvate dehydrogenase E1 component beta subunit [Haloactinopolyspora alba]|uniref:Pyruvate dehydrogenase E1 component beta subunit n=1 Tax=Haloactinopolyspora alba TaxID=648780 RepID=A0A2P8EFI3_9ACTN|nr:transketolase C-terminal domain-containing protein [Haloactinopolyspora alba]PSL08228.1 pyruvate dehydrogenase E1 component beta subunit [Haloactinopolyspora alba]
MPETRTISFGEAVNAALRRSLEERPEVLLYGEDVGVPGGVFGVTKGLHKQFGDRVFDTPISESAILGSAIGAAMFGRRPVVEIMWSDFFLVALDQVVNQAANVRYVSEGRLTAPLTIRTQQGAVPGSCAQHSQSLEAFFLHTPGIRVCMPSTAQDAYDLLLAAVDCDDPVVVIENRALYHAGKTEVEVGGPVAPIGGARPRRTGDAATVVSWGTLSSQAVVAADSLASEGHEVEVLETPWLDPFPWDDVTASVARTGRLVVAHEANHTGGFGAEILARVAESGITLRAIPQRVAVPDMRLPAAPELARAVLPDAAGIADAIRRVVS